ncbi:MAG: hypothetical protein ACE5FA_01115 [Dehalococcoidia bacterium]
MPTDAQLETLAERLSRDHLVDGIVYVRWGERYGTGADNALFSGLSTMQAAFRLACEPTLLNLARLHEGLYGLDVLTSATGTPGVLTRLAFPLENAWERIGYDPANTNMSNTWTRRKAEGWLYEIDGRLVLTRVTRDQLVGVIAGLSAAHVVLTSGVESVDPFIESQCLRCIERVTGNLRRRLDETRGSLRDHTGRTHGTRAHRARAPLRHALRLLDHHVNVTPLRGSLKWMYRWPWLFTWYYRFTRDTFAWNLRLTTALTLWLLGEKDAKRWVERCWRFVDHHNPWFQGIAETVGIPIKPRAKVVANARMELLLQRGYGGFFAWQKDWGEWGAPDRIGPGIDVLLPAYLQRWAEKERAA